MRLAALFDWGVGIVCAGAGVVVMGGWWLEVPGAVQIGPGLMPMLFNTALGLTSGGVALLALVEGRRRLAIASAAVVLLLGLLLLVEHGSGVNLGIDQLFADQSLLAPSPTPGRVGINASLCLSLLGIGLVSAAATPRFAPLSLISGMIVVLIAANALSSYVFGTEAGYVWSYTRMSVQTATGLGLIGLSLVLWSTRGQFNLRVVALVGLLLTVYVFSVVAIYQEIPQLPELPPPASARTEVNLRALVIFSGGLIVALVIFLAVVTIRANRAALALQKSENRYRAIIENTADGLITIDETGIMLSLNPACEVIFGHRISDCVGRNVKMLMPEPYHSAHDGYLDAYHRTGVRRIIGIGREVQGLRKDGTTFPIDLAVSEVRTGTERIYSGIVRDISERVHQTQALEAANRELEEFAYRTSHDLRAPIASTRGLMKVALEALDSARPDEVRDAIGRSVNSISRLESLIDDILFLTRIRKAVEEAQEVPMDDIVKQTLASLSNLDNFSRIEVRLAFRGAQVIRTRQTRVAAIVSNLLSNAIKYADLAKPKPFIAVTGAVVGQTYVLEVEDNGIGIPKDKQERVFEMFQRFHPRRSTGSGLGLYILKSTVTLLGGRVYHTPLKEGTKFTVELPATNP